MADQRRLPAMSTARRSERSVVAPRAAEKPGPRTSPGVPRYIWRAGPVLLFIAACAFAGLRAHYTEDLWISLACGRYIADHGQVPLTDPFSYTFGGRPFFNQNWLAHLAYYWSYARIGPWAVVGLFWLIVAAVNVMLLMAVRVRCRSWLAALIATALVAAASRNYLDIRPVRFSDLGLAATCLVLNAFIARGGTGRWWPALLLLPALMIWSNAHGSFEFGYGLIGLFVICWAISRYLAKRNHPQWLARLGVPATTPQIVALCAVAVVSIGLVAWLGPYGLANFTHPLVVGTSPKFREITEWRPAWEQVWPGPIVWPFWTLLAAAATVLLIAWGAGRAGRADQPRRVRERSAGQVMPGELGGQRRTLPLTLYDLAVVPLVLFMALGARRFTPLCYIVATPAIVTVILRLAAPAADRVRSILSAALRGGAWVGAGVMAGMAGVWTYQDLVVKYATHPTWDLLRRFTAYEHAPLYGIDFLRQVDCPLNIFTEWVTAAPVLFEVPQARVFIDGRSQQVYSEEHFTRFFALFDPEKFKASEALQWLADTGTDTVLLRTSVPETQLLDHALRGAPDWLLTLQTSASVLYMRRGSPPLERVAALERADQLRWPPTPSALATRGVIWLSTEPADEPRGVGFLLAAVEQDVSAGDVAYEPLLAHWLRAGQSAEAATFFRQQRSRVENAGPQELSQLERRRLLRIIGECETRLRGGG